jgi:hypothetical protein
MRFKNSKRFENRIRAIVVDKKKESDQCHFKPISGRQKF